MLIVEKGKIPSPYRSHKCPYCGTKFIYNRYNKPNGDVFRDIHGYGYVTCPYCDGDGMINGFIFRDKVVSYDDYEKFKNEIEKDGKR